MTSARRDTWRLIAELIDLEGDRDVLVEALSVAAGAYATFAANALRTDAFDDADDLTERRLRVLAIVRNLEDAGPARGQDRESYSDTQDRESYQA